MGWGPFRSTRKAFEDMKKWEAEIVTAYVCKHGGTNEPSSPAWWAGVQATMAIRNYGCDGFGIPNPKIYRSWSIDRFI